MRGLRMSLPPPVQPPEAEAPSSTSALAALPEELNLLEAATARVASLQSALRKQRAQLEQAQAELMRCQVLLSSHSCCTGSQRFLGADACMFLLGL